MVQHAQFNLRRLDLLQDLVCLLFCAIERYHDAESAIRLLSYQLSHQLMHFWPRSG
uniref:Transposase n=1 Tax=Macrostomum lignano TaxID=282301 RepID=A0A1I8GZ95_9PLAT